MAAVLVVCASTACSTSVDIVATRREPDAGDQYLSVPAVHGCKAGYYAGFVSSFADPDAGLQYPFSAKIEFTLLESRDTGEFLMLRSDAPLSGNTDTGASFSADIIGGNGCREGSVATYMKNGKYSFGAGASTIPFEGPIDGNYSEATRAFTGVWQAQLVAMSPKPLVVARGTWIALWVHK